MAEILVSYNTEQARREILKKALPGPERLTFLADVSGRDRADAIKRAGVVIGMHLSREFGDGELELLGNVRFVQLVTAGAEKLPFHLLPAQARIASNPGAFAVPMAEHVLGMVLAFAKRLCLNNAGLRRGEFDQKTMNRNLRGLAFGVLGFGGIGRAAAKLMRTLGLRVLAVNSSGRTDEEVEFIGTLEDLKYLLKNSDVLLVSIPLTVRTKGLIGRRELEWMKPDAILINMARGAIIDEKSLYDHLVGHPGFSAGIDAWWAEPSFAGEFRVDYPFFDLPNFLGSPHNSSITPGTMENALKLAADNVAAFLRGEKIRGEIRREDYLTVGHDL